MSFLQDDLEQAEFKPQQHVAHTQLRQHGIPTSSGLSESRQIIRSSIAVTAETNTLAQATAEELKAQTDQIHRIQRDALATSDNLATSEYLLKGMTGWWSSFTQLFTKPPQASEHHVAPKASRATPFQSPPQPIANSTDDSDLTNDLSQLSTMLHEMKERAIETGRELKYQNKEIQHIQDLSTRNNAKLDKQRKRLGELSGH